MSEAMKPVVEEELHAYVDGQLDAVRRAEVEQWLVNHPQAMARVRAYRDQNKALRKLFDPVLEEPLPPCFTASLKPKMPRWGVSIAAATAWLMVGTLAGYLVHDNLTPAPSPQRFVEHAALAHVIYTAEIRHPVEVTADQQVHLLTWLSNRIGKPLHTPDFSRMGYQLVGGRLLPGQRAPAAQFMYEDRQNGRLTLYVSTSMVLPAEFHYREEDGVKVLYWAEDGLNFALVGSVDQQRLMELAHVTYKLFGD